jgi:uncharacterized protein (TIGR00725 family)
LLFNGEVVGHLVAGMADGDSRDGGLNLMNVCAVERTRALLEQSEVAPVVPAVSGDDLAAALEPFAEEYDAIRHESPSGSERTALMTRLVGRISKSGTTLPPAFLSDFYKRPGDGHRVVALACCAGSPDNFPLDLIATSLREPRSRFEQWTALAAVEAVVSRVPVLDAESYVALVLERLDEPADWINEAHDLSRSKVAHRIVSTFAKAVGFPSTRGGDAVREWIDGASARHRGQGRCVAVFGSDASGRSAALCRELGARLAVHGWRVVTGRGDNVGTAIADGYQTAGRPAGLAIFTTGRKTTDHVLATRTFKHLSEARQAMVSEAHCAIVIGGKAGTVEELQLALDAGLPVLAIAHTGGAADKVAPNTNHLLAGRGVPRWWTELLENGAKLPLAAEQIVRVANMAVLTENLRPRSKGIEPESILQKPTKSAPKRRAAERPGARAAAKSPARRPASKRASKPKYATKSAPKPTRKSATKAKAVKKKTKSKKKSQRK